MLLLSSGFALMQITEDVMYIHLATLVQSVYLCPLAHHFPPYAHAHTVGKCVCTSKQVPSVECRNKSIRIRHLSNVLVTSITRELLRRGAEHITRVSATYLGSEQFKDLEKNFGLVLLPFKRVVCNLI